MIKLIGGMQIVMIHGGFIELVGCHVWSCISPLHIYPSLFSLYFCAGILVREFFL